MFETGDGFGVFGFSAVEFSALPEDGFDAFGNRAVRVVFGFAAGVVFAVDGYPFTRDHACGQPQPKAEKMCHGRV